MPLLQGLGALAVGAVGGYLTNRAAKYSPKHPDYIKSEAAKKKGKKKQTKKKPAKKVTPKKKQPKKKVKK